MKYDQHFINFENNIIFQLKKKRYFDNFSKFLSWQKEIVKFFLKNRLFSDFSTFEKNVYFLEFEKIVEEIIVNTSKECSIRLHDLFKLMKEKTESSTGRQEIAKIFK